MFFFVINSLQTFKKKERTRTRCFQNQVLSRTRCLLSAIFSLLYGQTPTTVSQVLLELGACCRQFFSLLYGQTPTTVSVLRKEVKYQENDQVLLELGASRTRCFQNQVLLELGACCRQFFSLLYGQTPTTVSVLRTEVKYQENDQVLLERSASRTKCLLLAIFFVTQSLISNPYDAILNLKTRWIS